MTNAEILRIAQEQHAVDASCAPEDFCRKENVVVVSRQNEKARAYLELPFFCDLISYGANVVASVDAQVLDVVSQCLEHHHIEGCFETPALHELTEAFLPYGKYIKHQAEYWLPDVNVLRALPCPYEVRTLYRDEFAQLYRPEWGNAISGKRPHLDVLGAGAYDHGRLIGLAGCSADCDTMWQIGIDVLPEYRRQGVAAALTSRLAVEALQRGKVPFYCCAWSNIGSARNAIASGFRPAWVEMTAKSAST